VIDDTGVSIEMRKFKWLPVIIIMVILLASSSCSKEASTTPLFWHSDNSSGFVTNDVERARNEIPFHLMLPDYLPGDIIPGAVVIQGPLKGTYPDDARILIAVRYSWKNGITAILMEVVRQEITTYPLSNSNSAYLEISGVQVLEYDRLLPGYPPDTEKYRKCNMYHWNRDGIHYDVSIIECGRDEARMIIQSMFPPMD